MTEASLEKVRTEFALTEHVNSDAAAEVPAEVADAGPCTVSGDVRELEFALLW